MLMRISRRISAKLLRKGGTKSSPWKPPASSLDYGVNPRYEDESSSGYDLPAGEDDHPTSGRPSDDVSWYRHGNKRGAVMGAVLGAGVAVVGAPLAIGAVGFGAGGIAASSYAGSLMSAAALANGGGVAAGSLVAVLQSIGVAGFSVAGLVGIGATGATVGAAVGTSTAKQPRKV